MKIIYSANLSQWSRPPSLPYDTYISLSQNEWDDFGNRTSLNIKLVIKGEEIEVNSVLKLKIENSPNTYRYLNNLIENGWDGVFPIPEIKYISLPNNILFYQALKSTLELQEIKETLSQLNDVVYLENFLPDSENLELKSDESFYSSLLRESGEKLAYREGYNVLIEKNFDIEDFEYEFYDKYKNKKSIKFNLNSDYLPYHINVLIGPNGVGKSFFIKDLLSKLLSLEIEKEAIRDEKILTSFDRIILISYSLFEEYNVDLNKYKELQNKKIYKYFGFRKRKEDGGIGISRNTPTSDSANSLIKCIKDDIQFDYIKKWVSKFETIFEVLNKAFEFDEICLFKDGGDLINHNDLFLLLYNEGSHININYSKGIVFKNKDEMVNLSSGQRFFSFMIINILAHIKDLFHKSKNDLLFG